MLKDIPENIHVNPRDIIDKSPKNTVDEGIPVTQPKGFTEKPTIEFCVFPWMAISLSGSITLHQGETASTREGVNSDLNKINEEGSDQERLENLLRKIDTYLGSNRRLQEKRAYNGCFPKTVEDIDYWIKSTEARHKEQDQNQHALTSAKGDLVRSAKQIFEFFLPLNISSTISKKYWGALYCILMV